MAIKSGQTQHSQKANTYLNGIIKVIRKMQKERHVVNRQADMSNF